MRLCVRFTHFALANTSALLSPLVHRVVRDRILKVFRECGGVVITAATRLGLHRTTLNAMMRKLDISRQDLGRLMTMLGQLTADGQ
jgi:transcriptional regulator with GAF, ATPase, and Fis domain